MCFSVHSYNAQVVRVLTRAEMLRAAPLAAECVIPLEVAQRVSGTERHGSPGTSRSLRVELLSGSSPCRVHPDGDQQRNQTGAPTPWT